jgi:ABC-type dipeptide/oligopeptide/nickel transport system permease subunit
MSEDADREDADGRIDATFRNGSVTAVGIILGFSSGFFSQWVANPIAWSKVDLVAAIPIIVGIVLQGKAFADLLSTACLVARNYERARWTFLVGLALVAAGVALALLLDVLGLGPRTLSS